LAPVRYPHSVREAWTLLSNLRWGRRHLLKIIRTERPELLHANSSSAMLFTPSVAHLPVIWQVRDLTPLGIFGSCMYGRASRVAVISSAVRAEVERYARDGGGKISLLPPAVDTAVFQPVTERSAVRTALDLPTDVPLIGLLAQFVPWKRHHLFLDALTHLTDLRWHAVMGGADFNADPAYLFDLRARITCFPFAGRISWLSWQHDPSALLSALDICALTSKFEPFGRVLIEAMACAVPVVSVDEGGVRDIIRPEENGLLTSPDPVALAAALRRLLENAALRERLGLSGRAYVQTYFSLEVQRRKLDELYSLTANSC